MTAQAKIDRDAIFNLILKVQDARNEAWLLLNGAEPLRGERERAVVQTQMDQMDRMIDRLCRA